MRTVEWWDRSETTVEINEDETITVRYRSIDGTWKTDNRYDIERAMAQADGHQQLARALRLAIIDVHNRKTRRGGEVGAMAKDRPQHEATAQAKLDGHTTSQDAKHEGFHLGDESGRRAGAGQAGEGSNRSDREQ